MLGHAPLSQLPLSALAQAAAPPAGTTMNPLAGLIIFAQAPAMAVSAMIIAR